MWHVASIPNEAKSILHNKVGVAGTGVQYFPLQRRKPPLLTDYSLQWGKQRHRIFFSNLKSFTAHSVKYGSCGMDVYSHFNNLVLIMVRHIFVAVFLFKKFY